MRCLLLASALIGAGCGGGDTGGVAVAPPAPPVSIVFTSANAWSGSVPADAESISADAFEAAVNGGEASIIRADSVAAARAARLQQFQADRLTLGAVARPSAAIAALLTEAGQSGANLDDVVLPPSDDHPVVIAMGLAARLRNAAETYTLSQRADNALAVYRQLHGLLPPAAQADVPAPDSLVGKPMSDVEAAQALLDARIRQIPRPAGERIDTRALEPPTAMALGVQPGGGRDSDGSCRPPVGLAATHWFPQKYFMGPIKQQGRRNTCWAFGAIGALESREYVQNGQVVNLSEQFLVNKIKEHWSPDVANESGTVTRALNLASANNQVMPPESFWTYNPGEKRLNVTDLSDYSGICSGYSNGTPAGTCSESAHESGQICTLVDRQTYCAYRRVTYSGQGVMPAPPRIVWTPDKPFELATLRRFLDSGVVLMASMPVYRGFEESARTNGVLEQLDETHYDSLTRKYVAGSAGSHVVQIVGFLDNDQLSQPGQPPAAIAGGGYFIIKNSWGCTFGDHGLAYISADYVKRYFESLTVIEFDARRSAAWTNEQVVPGAGVAPVVTATWGTFVADLRVTTDLARLFKVSHPDAKSVRLVVTSDVEGTIYDGPWITDRGVIGGSSLPHAFTGSGRHLLGIVAFYGNTSSERLGIAVDVRNYAPTLVLQGSGIAHQGEPYAITAVASDLNEPDARLLCNNARWSVQAPDTISGTSGCAQRVTFAGTGSRTVTVSTSDQEGQSVQQTLTVVVEPPAANPYPRIVAAGAWSRQMAGAIFQSCQDVAVPSGSTIDLRDTGCISQANETAPLRYTARVQVENPSNEPLGYEWNLLVSSSGAESNVFNGPLASTTATASLPSQGNQADVTHDCRVTVTVKAPDPARNKTQTVWSGICKYRVGRIN